MINYNIALFANTTWYLYNFRLNTIKELLSNKFNVYIFSPIDIYSSELVKIGCIHVNINFNSKTTNIFSNLLIFIKTFLFIRRFKIDILLTFTPKPNIFGSFACKFYKTKSVNNISGFGSGFNLSFFNIKYIDYLYKYSINSSFKVFVQINYDLYYITNNIIKKDKVILIPGSGVDVNKFNFSPINHFNKSNPFIFVFVGRLLKSKGVLILFEAASKLFKVNNKFKIIILGKQDFSNPDVISNSEIKSMSTSFFEFLFHVDNVYDFLKKSHCVILPSFYKEGTPKALLEALSVGRPIITTDIPGCKETVTNNNGYIVKPNDVNSLYISMSTLINLPYPEIEKMGLRSRELALNTFDERIVINQYMQCINKCLTYN